MSDWINASLLGLIEGVTEFLPISSTGHLLLAEHWLAPESELFNTLIQWGAMLAVIFVFIGRIKHMALRWHEPEPKDYILKLGAAFGVTCGGLAIAKLLHVKLPERAGPVAMALVVGGVLFLLAERWIRGGSSTRQITWKIAIAVGLGQIIAGIFPGASRSGTTILFALLLGLDRKTATEFSFLLGIPTLFAAGALQIAEAIHHHEIGSVHWGMLFLATAVAFVTAFVVVQWLLRFVQTHTFVVFGWYRIAVGIAVLAILR